MTVRLSPLFNDQTFDTNGDPAVGYKLFTYAAGSSTKQATYTDSSGAESHPNPIILNGSGYPANGPIWLTSELAYKFVLTDSTDTDPPTSPFRTIDDVSGINDTGASFSQWVASGVTPVYVSATSFTLSGDQTSEFHVGRRLQCTVSGGTVYGTISASIFGVLTTVTLTMDAGQALDAGLTDANLSVLRNDVSALPKNLTGNYLSNTTASTPTQFDAGLSTANMAAIQRALGNFRGGFPVYTTPVTLTADQVGMLVNVFLAASVINLPDGADVLTGSSFRFYVGVTVTLNGVGGQFIYASPADSGGPSMALPPNSVYDVMWNDTAWIVSPVYSDRLSSASGAAPSYSARAWVDFDGTGTPAIRGSGNVSSITDNGVGDYTVNFTTAMPDANYATVGMVGGTASSFVVRIPDAPAQVAGSQRVWTMNNSSVLQDIAYINLSFFR